MDVKKIEPLALSFREIYTLLYERITISLFKGE